MPGFWDTFKKALIQSIGSIDDGYFHVRRHVGGPGEDATIELKLLERVYAYELYHQLRRSLGDIQSYMLHGELDKRWQQIMRERGLGDVPDLVVHKPGRWGERQHKYNLVIIEVKSTSGQRAPMVKDIKKLLAFIERANYHHGILLLYGPERPTSTARRK
jgi:hypothetical protein